MRQGEWVTSTFSATLDCVEVRCDGETILVRDTKDRDGGTLTFTRKEWKAFTSGVKADEFDL